MNINYLETLTLEVLFRHIISFSGRINYQCMSSLPYTGYCQKQPSEQRRFVKKGVLKDFVNFIRKHLCQSLRPDAYFEEHLPTSAFALHSHHSLLLIRFTLYSAPSSSSSLLLLLISPMFVFGSISKGFKEFKSGSSFSLKSLSSLLFSFYIFFSVFLSFVSYFLVACS